MLRVLHFDSVFLYSSSLYSDSNNWSCNFLLYISQRYLKHHTNISLCSHDKVVLDLFQWEYCVTCVTPTNCHFPLFSARNRISRNLMEGLTIFSHILCRNGVFLYFTIWISIINNIFHSRAKNRRYVCYIFFVTCVTCQIWNEGTSFLFRV